MYFAVFSPLKSNGDVCSVTNRMHSTMTSAQKQRRQNIKDQKYFRFFAMIVTSMTLMFGAMYLNIFEPDDLLPIN